MTSERWEADRHGYGHRRHLCNAFLPARQEAWDAAIAGQGLPLKVRRDDQDSFTTAEEMVRRMDELGIATLTLVASDVHHHGTAFDVSTVTARWEEAEELARRFPGRFVALWGIEPQRGMAGVRRADEALSQPWVVGAVPAHPQLRPAVRPCRLLPVLRSVRPARRADGDAGRYLRRAHAERVRQADRYRPAGHLLSRGALRAVAHRMAVGH